eukprot:6191290-Pleurochrysis_carterae.AAC.2
MLLPGTSPEVCLSAMLQRALRQADSKQRVTHADFRLSCVAAPHLHEPARRCVGLGAVRVGGGAAVDLRRRRHEQLGARDGRHRTRAGAAQLRLGAQFPARAQCVTARSSEYANVWFAHVRRAGGRCGSVELGLNTTALGSDWICERATHLGIPLAAGGGQAVALSLLRSDQVVGSC